MAQFLDQLLRRLRKSTGGSTGRRERPSTDDTDGTGSSDRSPPDRAAGHNRDVQDLPAASTSMPADATQTFERTPKALVQMGLSGYARFAEHALSEMLDDDLDGSMRFKAGFGLARIHAHLGRYDAAADDLHAARRAARRKAANTPFRLLEADVLSLQGHRDVALDIALDLLRSEPDNRDVRAVLYGLRPNDTARLAELNAWLAEAGFAPLAQLDETQPLAIDNLGTHASAEQQSGPMVSVIMPAFNAEETLDMAARSILQQSWRNIELVIVDDASDDASWKIVQQIAASDDRVRPIRLSQNGGAYRARNTGLFEARGDFITINDSDDWSHPQRIATQLHAIADGHEAGLNFVSGLNTDRRLLPLRSPRSGRYVLPNRSSLLVSTDLLRRLGGWYDARLGSDAELNQRLAQFTGEEERAIHPDVPLSFMLQRPDSLTNSTLTSLDSRRYGVRRECREASAYWRSITPDLSIAPGERPYPIPRLALTRSDEPIRLSVLLVSDFSIDSSVNMDHIVQHTSANGRLGLFHLPRLGQFDVDVDIAVRKLIHEQSLAMIVGGEKVECDTVVVLDAAALEALPDLLPTIAARRCRIIGNESNRNDAVTAAFQTRAFSSAVMMEPA